MGWGGMGWDGAGQQGGIGGVTVSSHCMPWVAGPGGATTTSPDATPPPAICQNWGGGGLGLGSPSWWNQSWFYNPF